jgi:hypothetical protein
MNHMFWVGILIGIMLGALFTTTVVAYYTISSLDFYRNQTYTGWAVEQAIGKCASPPERCSFDSKTMVITCEEGGKPKMTENCYFPMPKTLRGF